MHSWECVILVGSSEFLPSFTFTVSLVKRLPEACCRGGVLQASQSPDAPGGHSRTSRGAVTEPRDMRRGCRETQRQASSLGQALKAASVQQRNQVSLLHKDECLQVFTNGRWLCCARLQSHFSQTVRNSLGRELGPGCWWQVILHPDGRLFREPQQFLPGFRVHSRLQMNAQGVALSQFETLFSNG